MARTASKQPPAKILPSDYSIGPGVGNPPAQLVRVANRWRDQYNPLRGLLISKLVSLLEWGQRGDYAELQWLYRFIERRFAVLHSLIIRRRSALIKLDWDVKVVSELPAGATDAMAVKQRDHLRSRYELIENLREAIKFLALAEFRGFSLLQKHRIIDGPNDGAVHELHWLPQWNFVRPGEFGPWFWNPTARTMNTNMLPPENQIDPAEFLIREVDMPIDEIGAIAFVNSGMAKKDWAAFVEMFGLPGCVIEMPHNIPAGKEDEFRDAAEKVAQGASGAVPSGATPHFPSSQIRGNAPFKEFLEAEKEDVVLAGTGGKLTMLNEPTGIGGGQAAVHESAFDEIAQSEAMEISEIFQKQFDKPELELAFPGEPVLAYFELAARDQEDVDAIADRVVKFHNAGFHADAAELSEKAGLKLVEKQAPNPIASAPQIGNRQSAVGNSDLTPVQRLGVANAEAMQPIRKRLEQILQIKDQALLRDRLFAFIDELPQLLRDINADPAQTSVIRDQLLGPLAAGLTGVKTPLLK